MILADTSVWIDFLRKREPVHSRFSDELKRGQILSTPWIFAELIQGAKKGYEIGKILEFWEVISKPLPSQLSDIWIDAGKASHAKHLHTKGIGLIDAAIAQTAAALNIPLWTLDKALISILPAHLRFEA